MSHDSFGTSDDFRLAVAAGIVKGVRNHQYFGAADLIQNVETDLSTLASVALPVVPLPLTAGEALEVVSDDVSDTETLLFEMLGPSGVALAAFPVTLNGTTPVLLQPLIGLVSRVNFGIVISDAGINGTVSVQQAGGGSVFLEILERNQQSLQAQRSFSGDAIIDQVTASLEKPGGADTSATISILFKRMTQQKWTRAFEFGMQTKGSSDFSLENLRPEPGIGPFDAKLVGLTDSSQTITVSGRSAGLDYRVGA